MEASDQRYPFRNRRAHPSFSSTLLDQIYRSIDDPDSMRKKNHLRGSDPHDVAHKIIVHRRSTAADFDRSAADSFFFKHSGSSSSDSSGFSSSESDSFYGCSRSSRSPPASRGRDHAAEVRQPRPVRTSVDRFERSSVQTYRSDVQKTNGNKQELGSFPRTKSKALKIYRDLKKVKQPISPGGRLASFLNSLFTAGNTKKQKKVTTAPPSTAAEQPLSSTCSSASSFSRSCLSKTPSSSGKSKRSVRFCPVSVILDEDSRPCGHKGLYQNETNHNHDHNRNRNRNIEALEIHVMEENRRVIEAAKNLLRTYQKNKEVDIINIDDEQDDDDAASYASSDLFELDNLSAIGIDRYREELPVYETTHLSTNRAIASGLIV